MDRTKTPEEAVSDVETELRANLGKDINPLNNQSSKWKDLEDFPSPNIDPLKQ